MQRSLLDGRWLPQFGGFDFTGGNIKVGLGAEVNGLFHAEAHHDRVLGADFTYSATISADWTQNDLSAHLQFRISDEGRYGVRLQAGTIVFYRFLLGDRPCAGDPNVITPCPLWPEPDVDHPERDDAPEQLLLGPVGSFDKALRALRVTVFAEGSRFVVSFGTPSQDLGRLDIYDIELGIGRFGIYVLAPTQSFEITFSDVVATCDPTATSNFALLYSTPGYDVNGTKRALVRTVNDIEPQDYDDENSSFTVTNEFGQAKIRHKRFEVWRPFRAGHFEAWRLPKARAVFRQTLGFQFLAADFTELREAGQYKLKARLTTSGGVRVIRSAPFNILPRLVTEKMLWPLSILNANARRAADEDFRRNWVIESGGAAWSVSQDGAFVADRADGQAGAVLRRAFTIGTRPLSDVDIHFRDFRFVARITIVSGCDAQLQFRITNDERWAVTLQAGEAGGCRHGTTRGAIRLHREGPAVPGRNHFEVVAWQPFDSNPFEVGRPYDLEVRTSGEQIEVLLDGTSVLLFAGAMNPRVGEFALKAWASTVRFEDVAVWARDVGLSRPVPGVWIPYDRATNLSSQGFRITTPDSENGGVRADPHNLSYPLVAQQHGFHDCNSYIGEVTSHSVFLSSLLDVWTARAHDAPSQQEDLRHAIITAVLYLKELYEQGNRSGAFAHQEPGRASLDPFCNKLLTTQFAMYGLSAFAEKGHTVDRNLARDAFHLATKAWDWLDENVGPLGGSWMVDNVEHVAASSSQGDLLVFFFSPDKDWQVVNVSQKVGEKIAGAPSTSWVIGNVEHVAASSLESDLLVFFFSPDKDWQVVNVSQKLGQKIAGAPSTSWVIGNVEHVAASSLEGDLLVFFFSPDKDWQVVNVSQKLGQKIAGAPSTSWVIGNVEHVAASSLEGDLLVFFFSPDKDWQVVNVSQKLGQKIAGAPSASWVIGNVEHVAASSLGDDLLVFFFSPDKDWQLVNVSQKVGQKIAGAPSTSWVVGNVEHVAAGLSEGGDLLVFFFSPDKDWQVVNVSVAIGQYQGRRDIVFDSIVALRIARAAQREGMAATGWFGRAETNVGKVLATFGQPDGIANQFRPTLRSIPWFEGVYEFYRGQCVLPEPQQTQVANIAEQLLALVDDPANGFCIMPQADDAHMPPDPTLPVWNWNHLADLPLAVYHVPATNPVGDWYLSEHFATAAADCVYIGRLAGQNAIERLATGNLYWILGLNPGIPTTKVVPPVPRNGPWSAASFVYNGPGAFARTIEGNRTRTNDVKKWLANWELSASSGHREIWAIDPLNNGFQSTVNGHVLRESQWHYWSVGTAGWVGAETFMLIDASFVKAALALEDWHSGII